jgi:hypothetical protein
VRGVLHTSGHFRPYSPECVERLSEKGYEQRSDREFGWYTDDEMDRKAPLWRPAELGCKRLRGFSDSLGSMEFSEVQMQHSA